MVVAVTVAVTVAVVMMMRWRWEGAGGAMVLAAPLTHTFCLTPMGRCGRCYYNVDRWATFR